MSKQKSNSKKLFDTGQMKKGGKQIALGLLGGTVANLSITKSPDSIKKYVPVALGVLSLAGVLIAKNEDVNSFCAGSGVIATAGIITQFTTPAPKDVAVNPADGTVTGLSGAGQIKGYARQLLPAVGAGTYDLGNVDNMQFDFSDMAYEMPYQATSLLGTEKSAISLL